MEALKSCSCECSCTFWVFDGEDASMCLTCCIVYDLKAGKIQPPVANRLPMDSLAMAVGYAGRLRYFAGPRLNVKEQKAGLVRTQ
jgi:hypothetical protein